MKTWVVIPARMGSTRFPGKPLALIRGEPMVVWVARGARQAKKVEKVIVATDDQKIADVVRRAGFEARLTESDLKTGTDRVFSSIQKEEVDVVVNVQGDEPLIRGTLIDEMIQVFERNRELDMVSVSRELDPQDLSNPHVVKVLCDQKRRALYFSRFAIPYSRQSPEPGPLVCEQHIGIYGYKFSFLKKFCGTPVCKLEEAESLEQLRALWMGAYLQMIATKQVFRSVDTPQDLEKLEADWEKIHG